MDRLSSSLKYALMATTMIIGSAGMALAQPTPRNVSTTLIHPGLEFRLC